MVRSRKVSKFPIPHAVPSPNLHAYRILVELRFPPGSFADTDPPMRGAFITFGVTACSEEESRQLIIDFLARDSDLAAVQWEIVDFEVSEHSWGSLPDQIDDIRKYLKASPGEIGVWYNTGKLFFPEDEDDLH